MDVSSHSVVVITRERSSVRNWAGTIPFFFFLSPPTTGSVLLLQSVP